MATLAESFLADLEDLSDVEDEEPQQQQQEEEDEDQEVRLGCECRRCLILADNRVAAASWPYLTLLHGSTGSLVSAAQEGWDQLLPCAQSPRSSLTGDG